MNSTTIPPREGPPELPPTGHLLAENDYIPEPAAADAVGVSTQTFIAFRKAGRGPPFTMIGRKYFYHRPGLKDWLAAGGTAAAVDRRAQKKAVR